MIANNVRDAQRRTLPGAPKVEVGKYARKRGKSTVMAALTKSEPGAPVWRDCNERREEARVLAGWERHQREVTKTLPGAPSLKRGRVCGHGGSRNAGKKLATQHRAQVGRVALPAVKEEPVGRTLPDCAKLLAGARKPAGRVRSVLCVEGWPAEDLAWLGGALFRAVLGRPGDFVEGRRAVEPHEVAAVLVESGMAPGCVARLGPWLR